MTPDADKLNEFLSKFVNDLGAALHAGMVVIGYKLGLYKGGTLQGGTLPRRSGWRSEDQGGTT